MILRNYPITAHLMRLMPVAMYTSQVTEMYGGWLVAVSRAWDNPAYTDPPAWVHVQWFQTEDDARAWGMELLRILQDTDLNRNL